MRKSGLMNEAKNSQIDFQLDFMWTEIAKRETDLNFLFELLSFCLPVVAVAAADDAVFAKQKIDKMNQI